MKKTIFTITAIGILGVLACSNKKDPAPAPKSKTELLTAHTWKAMSKKYSSSMDKESIEDCEKDDLYTFKSDSSLVYNSNLLKCNGKDSMINLQWKFVGNENTIETIQNGSHANTLKIISIDENSFEFRDEDSIYFKMIK